MGGEFGGEWILVSPARFLYLLLCSVSCVLIHHIAAGKLPWTLVRDYIAAGKLPWTLVRD